MQKSHISGQPQSTRQSRSRAAMSLRTAAQRRSRSRSESRGSSRTSRIANHLIFSLSPEGRGRGEGARADQEFLPQLPNPLTPTLSPLGRGSSHQQALLLRLSHFLRSLQLQPLQAFQIIGDAALEIELWPVAELVAGAGNVVDAVHRVGRAEEVQSR